MTTKEELTTEISRLEMKIKKLKLIEQEFDRIGDKLEIKDHYEKRAAELEAIYKEYKRLYEIALGRIEILQGNCSMYVKT